MKTGEDHGKEPREQLLIQAMVTASANSSSLGSEALLDGGSFGPRFFWTVRGGNSFGPCEQVFDRASPCTSPCACQKVTHDLLMLKDLGLKAHCN